MLIISEKIPPRRPQVFNDDAAIDAAVAVQYDRQHRWIRYMMEDLARAVRNIGARKPS
jgi:hypothetical protein